MQNAEIMKKLKQGKMTLIKDHYDQNQMSLNKIQYELSVINSMDPEYGGEQGERLQRKVWNEFKHWRNQK